MKKIIFTIAIFLISITYTSAQSNINDESRAKIDKQMLDDSKNPKLIKTARRLEFLKKTSVLSYADDQLKKIHMNYISELKNDPGSWDAIKMTYSKIYAKVLYDIEVNYKNWALDMFIDNSKDFTQKEIDGDRESIIKEMEYVAKRKSLMLEIFK